MHNKLDNEMTKRERTEELSQFSHIWAVSRGHGVHVTQCKRTLHTAK